MPSSSRPVGTADRLLRFVAASALLHALLAPATYQAYRVLIASGRVQQGRALPWWIWVAAASYAVGPALLGDQVGRAARRQQSWAAMFTGPAPAPRGWDHLFARKLTGWIRVRLLDPGVTSAPAGPGTAETVTGRWLVGAFSAGNAGVPSSYAAGYPEVQDLFLADTAVCDPGTGEFLLNQNGEVVLRGVSVLLRWDQIAYLEFIAG